MASVAGACKRRAAAGAAGRAGLLAHHLARPGRRACRALLRSPGKSPAPRPGMAGGRRGPLFAAFLAAWVVAVAEAEADREQAARPPEQSLVRPMTASNWTLVMEGEWMLKL